MSKASSLTGVGWFLPSMAIEVGRMPRFVCIFCLRESN